VTEECEVISGTFVLARSKFNALLEMAAEGKIDVIVVDIPDRLGRGDAIAKCELLADMNGCKIEYAKPGYDKSTTEGFVQHSAQQMVSGIERLNISRRTKEGRREYAARGRVIQSTFRPYGYNFHSERDDRGRKTLCELIVIEDEAQVLRDIFTWYGIDGMSPSAIAQRLTLAGAKSISGGPWAKSSVSYILRNKTYIGQWGYGKREVKSTDAYNKAKKVSRARTEEEDYIITVAVPAIIPLPLWNATQARLTRNRGTGGKPALYPYLLRGHIKCAKCGGTMVSESTKRECGAYLYYKCRNAMSDTFGVKRCNSLRVRADVIEPRAWQEVKKALEDEDRLFAGVEHQREEHKQARHILIASIAGYDATIANLQARIKRAYDAYLDGAAPLEGYKADKKRIDAEIEKAQAQRVEVEEKLRDLPSLTAEQEAHLRQWRLDVLAGIDSATFEEKRQYLEWLSVQVICNPDTGETVVSGVFGEMIPSNGL
jgi:site-specific DNA recombinase